MRRVLTTAAAVLALFFVPQAVHAQSYVPGDETKVQTLLNATRGAKGLATLARNDQLVAMARGQATRMADRGSIFHNPNLGGEITERGLDWQKVGENVGMGPNVDLIEQAFLDSPHHYENIVDPQYDSVGIGVVNGDDGKRYVVQVFADLKAPAAAAPKPAAPASAPASAPVTTQQTGVSVAPEHETPAPATPKASPPPAPAPPSADPNAVIGHAVTPLDLGSTAAI
jgi:cysteine-rich secretory family protein